MSASPQASLDAAVRFELAIASLGLGGRTFTQSLVALAPEVDARLAMRVRSGFDWAAFVTYGTLGNRQFVQRVRQLAYELGQPPPPCCADLPVRSDAASIEIGVSQGADFAAMASERASSTTIALELEPLTKGPSPALQPVVAAQLLQLASRLGNHCAAVADAPGQTARAVRLGVVVGPEGKADIDAVMAGMDVTRPQRDYFATTFEYLGVGRPVLVRIGAQVDQLVREVRVEYAAVGVEDIVKVMTTFEGPRMAGPLGGIVGALGVSQGALELGFCDRGAPRLQLTFEPVRAG